MPDTAKAVKARATAAALTSDQGITTASATARAIAGLTDWTVGICRAGTKALLQAWTAETVAAKSFAAAVTSDHRITVALASSRASGAADDFASDPALARYELFHALSNDEFDFSAPAETFTSLPHTTAPNYGGNGSHRFVVRRRNAFNLSDQNVAEQVFKIISGNAVSWPPSMPLRSRLEQSYLSLRHRVIARAEYYNQQDPDDPASYFYIWFRTDGTTPPDPNLNIYPPTEVVAMAGLGGNANALYEILVPIAANGQVIKAYIATARTAVPGYWSRASDLLSLTVNTAALTAPTGREIRHQRRNR